MTLVLKSLEFEMYRAKARPLSASRKQRQQQRSRRHSLNDNRTTIDREYTFNGSAIEPNTFYAETDFRAPKEIIQSLEKEILERKNNCTVNKNFFLFSYCFTIISSFSSKNI